MLTLRLPLSLSAQAGLCSSSLAAQLASLLFASEPSPEQLCASCKDAAHKALAALDASDTQLRAYAAAACAQLPGDAATQCAALVDSSYEQALAAAVAFLSDPQAACHTLRQCPCAMHAAMAAQQQQGVAMPLALQASLRMAEQAAVGAVAHAHSQPLLMDADWNPFADKAQPTEPVDEHFYYYDDQVPEQSDYQFTSSSSDSSADDSTASSSWLAQLPMLMSWTSSSSSSTELPSSSSSSSSEVIIVEAPATRTLTFPFALQLPRAFGPW